MKRKSMVFFRKIFICGIIAISAFAHSCARGGSSKKEPGVASSRIYPVQEVQKKNAVLESIYPVTLQGEDNADIKPRVSGYIDQVYVKEGDIVKKGQRLFSINSPSSEQDFTAAEAALASAEAQLSTAKIDVERIRTLADKDIVSGIQLQNYENAKKTAEANKLKAEAALTTARATLHWTIVPSPVDGAVGSIPYRKGNLVTSATSLTTISNTKTIYAYFSINEKKLAELLGAIPGDSQAEKIMNIADVSLLFPNGNSYSEKGKISAISGIINSVTGSATLRAEFPNPQGILKSGASGNISIPREVADVIVIPQKATFSLQDKTIVYKALATNKTDMDSIVQTMITVLPLPDGQNYVVTSGLADGDKIVADGVATLRNGSLIKTR